ncbi:hypothetical protein HYH03_018758 [Edaphochlamys debaryana]|uniref:Uncharacterized protein n=1 Tax=Edaphochlamys debaryana TaxID=47281 RepID=A0A835XH93_9CHLO|nr:hypothetical protein HYH03_018758 [Edaphochlamys debaryana]|eukprot:KAG2482316.1 hypothetical protein HYH03_018758 [Edaphochlamys debaryana]
MNHMLRLRVEKADDSYVKLWDHQGALIIAFRDEAWVQDVTAFVPPKLMNSYPYKLIEASGVLKDCGDPQGAECQQGYWTPGDWLIHFPGAGKLYWKNFLAKHPPETWPGFADPFNFRHTR